MLIVRIPNTTQTTTTKSLICKSLIALVENKFGWGGGIRTPECRNQNPMPYHLATPQRHSVNVSLPNWLQNKFPTNNDKLILPVPFKFANPLANLVYKNA